jgi:hypothetical protein
MGVAAAAPRLRRALGWSTGMPQPILGLIEDYLALNLGSEAVGMPLEALVDAAKESLEEVTGRPEEATCLTEAEAQSAGAGSM